MCLLERARRRLVALNAMDLDTAVAMISPSAEIRTPMGSFTGGEAYREWISEQFRAFPDPFCSDHLYEHEENCTKVKSGKTKLKDSEGWY